MGLETPTYVSQFNPLWPLAGDLISQGDDHLRNLKTALQNTFPNATKPWYFPRVTTKSASYSVVRGDEQTSFFVDTTAGNATLTLPTLTATETGWTIKAIKSDGSANTLLVAPPSGTINGAASVSSTTRWFALTIIWTGTEYISVEQDLTGAINTTIIAMPQDERAAPAAFNSSSGVRINIRGDVTPVCVNGVGPGQVVISKTPYDLAIALFGTLAGDAIWVDGTNGDDANTGDIDSPYATLVQALEVSTAKIVNVLPGVYNPVNSQVGVDAGATVFKHIRTPLGRVRITVNGTTYPDTTTGSGWSNTSGAVYEWTLGLPGGASVHRVIRPSVTNRWGYATTARLRTSIVDLQNNYAADTNGGWWFDSGTGKLYMTFGNVSPGTRFRALYLDAAGTARMYSAGARWLFDGEFDFEGVQFDLAANGASPAYCFFWGDILTRKCPRILFPPATGILSAGAVMFASGLCVHASENDCINYFTTYSAGTHNFGIEHDVMSTYAGDIQTFGTGIVANRQGSSAHGGTDVIRMGCYYAENYGQNIADTAIVSDTSYTWIIGCYTEDAGDAAAAGIEADGSGVVGGERYMWIDTCRTSGELNTRCIYVTSTGGFMKYYNCVLNAGNGAAATDGTGSLTTYTPLAP